MCILVQYWPRKLIWPLWQTWNTDQCCESTSTVIAGVSLKHFKKICHLLVKEKIARKSVSSFNIASDDEQVKNQSIPSNIYGHVPIYWRVCGFYPRPFVDTKAFLEKKWVSVGLLFSSLAIHLCWESRRRRKGGALARSPLCWKCKLCQQAGQQASADPDTSCCQQSSCHGGRGGTKHRSCHHSLFSGRSLKPHSTAPPCVANSQEVLTFS